MLFCSKLPVDHSVKFLVAFLVDSPEIIFKRCCILILTLTGGVVHKGKKMYLPTIEKLFQIRNSADIGNLEPSMCPCLPAHFRGEPIVFFYYFRGHSV